MALTKGLFVSSKTKPDVPTVGDKPSSISTTNVDALSEDDFYALNRSTTEECIIHDAHVETARASVLQSAIARLAKLAGIPIPSAACAKLSAIISNVAKVQEVLLSPVELTKLAFDELMVGLNVAKGIAEDIADLCDLADATIPNFDATLAASQFLDLFDQVLELHDPALFAKLAECPGKLAALPASILHQATKQLANQSLESLVILVDEVENTKLSDLEDTLKDAAGQVGDLVEQYTHFESLMTVAGKTIDELVLVNPLGFDPGADILDAQSTYRSARNGTKAYDTVVSPATQMMAVAAIGNRDNPVADPSVAEGGGPTPTVGSVNSDKNGVVLNTNAPSAGGANTLVFGDTWEDQTGFIHILNDGIAEDQKVGIYRNNREVNSRKLNPVPLPVPSYA